MGCMNIMGGGGGNAFNKVMGSSFEHNPAGYFDPLGNDASGRMTGITGGPEQRARIFARMNQVSPQIDAASDAAAGRAMTAANDPGFADSAALARRTIRGDFLNGSPALDAAMSGVRRNQMASAADSGANIRSGYARNGMGFSTANQQADQANTAAAAARAGETEAGTRLQNYQTERGYQNQGNQQLNESLSSPLNYLSQVSASQLAPLSQEAGIIAPLTGGSPRPDDIIEKDGYLRQLTKTVGAL